MEKTLHFGRVIKVLKTPVCGPRTRNGLGGKVRHTAVLD